VYFACTCVIIQEFTCVFVGALGLVCAALGATATLTDLDCVFFLMQENKDLFLTQQKQYYQQIHGTTTTDEINAFAEELSERVILSMYDWGSPPPEHLTATALDLVIVSDCVLPKLYPIEPLVQAVEAVMGPHTVALFSYEHRPYPYFDPRYVRPNTHGFVCLILMCLFM
jgi:LmbE family N-acetylglucosaminyl deacetylase